MFISFIKKHDTKNPQQVHAADLKNMIFKLFYFSIIKSKSWVSRVFKLCL